MILLLIHEYYKDEYQNIEANANAINSIGADNMNAVFPKILLIHYSFIFLMTIYPYIRSHALR